jgi:hypothetical protein
VQQRDDVTDRERDTSAAPVAAHRAHRAAFACRSTLEPGRPLWMPLLNPSKAVAADMYAPIWLEAG